ALMIGVLHHLPGTPMKAHILKEVSARLKPGAPLVLAGNYRAYASQPLLMAAWAERWRLHGAGPAQIEAKMAKILHGAEPPVSEEAVFSLLSSAGFEAPLRFFSSLFWGAWLARRVEAK
ncbi:MAG: class I SAM-dependent methyltransferase, partial [Phyllobacterium sp.]